MARADDDRKTTVLVVEDQPVERRLLYHTLKHDHDVLEAADVEQALSHLRSRPVDLVILDLQLPPHTEDTREGARLHRAILDRHPPPPVIVTTASSNVSVRQRLSSRVAAYLPKPVSPDVLLAAVERALGTGNSTDNVLNRKPLPD